ncbi:MAG: uroporphyrinogen decarboxylase family protein [Clostridia bacterium]
MKGRERLLTALDNRKPDHLPCQVHNWMSYYRNHYLGGKNDYEAYEYFDMDPVIYTNPEYRYRDSDLSSWQVKNMDMGTKDGIHTMKIIITTPKGTLTAEKQSSEITSWLTEHFIKDQKDFELWNTYLPMPVEVDWSPVIEVKKRLGDKGIARGSYFDFGQGSPWQSLAYMYGTEQLIMSALDDPDWTHAALSAMLEKKLKVIELGGKIELDLVETGGGAGSSTVISPSIHRQFCLPYDQRQHKALRDHGTRVVYHLCGGFMPLLDMVVENGANGMETMTPPEMGGDCILSECTRRIGDRMFFIGGFDQNAGFESGNPELVREMVFKLHDDCPDGGYILCPSDHFFYGDPENIKAFVQAAKECVY